MVFDYDSPDGNYIEEDYICPYCGDPVEDDGDFCNPDHRRFHEYNQDLLT